MDKRINTHEKIIADAIQSERNLAITTEQWGTRIVFPQRLEHGQLHCEVILVGKPGDSGNYRPDTMAVKDMIRVDSY